MHIVYFQKSIRFYKLFCCNPLLLLSLKCNYTGVLFNPLILTFDQRADAFCVVTLNDLHRSPGALFHHRPPPLTIQWTMDVRVDDFWQGQQIKFSADNNCLKTCSITSSTMEIQFIPQLIFCSNDSQYEFEQCIQGQYHIQYCNSLWINCSKTKQMFFSF